MGLYSVPSHVRRRLKAYDPHLDIYWGGQDGGWRIERKIRPQRDLPQSLFANHDDWETARQGRCLILRVPHGQLDERVFYTLWAGDLQRRGGAQAVADEEDNAYDARLRNSMGVWGEKVEYQAREHYNYMNRVRTLPERFRHTAPPGGMTIND